MTELRKMFIADGDNGWLVGVDQMSEALEVIDYHHHEIHEGDVYIAEVHDASVAAAGTVAVAFKVPDGTKRAHMTFAFSCEGKAHLEVLEGATWTTNTGTVYAPVNQRRDSDNTSMLLEDKTATPAFTAGGVLTDPTVVGVGTTVREIYLFTASNRGGGGVEGTRDELILDVDETYVVQVTNDEGSAKGLQLRIEWYEHTDSN